MITLPQRTEGQRYARAKNACFVLAFDTRVEMTAEVTIEGIERSGEPVSLPGFRFYRRPARSTLVTQRPAVLEGLHGP